MSFSNPSRLATLRSTNDLIPKSKPTKRVSVPWSTDEQRAIAWLKSASPTQSFSDRLASLRTQSAAMILKNLSGKELLELVTMWKNRA